MQIKRIISDEMDQNCYLVHENGKGILIDPGYDTFKIIKETEGIEVNYILLTHCHFDHIYSLNKLRNSKTVVGSKKCVKNIVNPKITLLGTEIKIDRECEMSFADGEEKTLDGIKVKGIYTPGLSECSMCYLIDGKLFSGDTLFYKSIGRSDLPTGDYKTLENSIKNKLYVLPEETKVYPGHGTDTKIGYEKKYNLYCRMN